MAESTERTAPGWVPTTNALDNIPDDILDAPPAYYSLGSTPQPMSDPPNVGDKGTLLVRWECTGEGKTVRTDGELRYSRKLSVIWAVPEGQPRPPDPDSPQGALFDEEGEPIEGQDGWDDEPTDEPEKLGDIVDNVARPDFSSGEA